MQQNNNFDMIRLDCVDSTNSEAKRLAAKLERPLLICADRQTGGRGRLGRSFYSPAGEGLYMSLAYRADFSMTDAVKITSAAAVAVCRAIEKHAAVECGIKWVNDIYVSSRKVCGILCEAMTVGNANVIIVGVGINCTTADFPDEIADRAGVIGEVDKNGLAIAIAQGILDFTSADSSTWIDEYRERSIVLGRDITYFINGGTHTAHAEAIDENGALIVREGEKITVLSTGEITVRL